MRYSLVLCLVLLSFLGACGNSGEDTMQVTGTVKGLKKGILYFQRVEDTVLVTIDSLKINGNGDFKFSIPIESPELFYLYLEKNDGNADNDRILFFGEQGHITIETTRDFFVPEARISGSASQEKLEEFRKTTNRFNNVNLELIEAQFNALRENDTLQADSLRQLSEKNRRRRYLYALNFAINNKNSYVAPYIALSETPDAQLKYLDSIHNTLTPEVAASKYGKALGTLIADRKAAGKEE